mgnify:CR=1 FL=1
MSVLTYIENLEKKLRLSEDEKNTIEISINNLKTKIKNWFADDLIEILVFGSYKRNTNLCRRADNQSDVDIMIVFKDLGRKPQTYIDRIKRFMETKYKTSEIYQSNPCAILELQHIKFELTPAIWNYDNTYKIPDKASSYFDWMNTQPFYLDELSKKQTHIQYKQISRLVKYWNCLNRKYFASYELEKIVLNTTLYCYSRNLKENLFQVLNSINYDYSMPQYVRDYIIKTKEILRDIQINENLYPNYCENKIKTLFKELD